MNKFDTVLSKFLKEQTSTNPNIKTAANALANAARGKTGIEAAQIISDVSQQAASTLNPQKAEETEKKDVQDTNPAHQILNDIMDSKTPTNDIHTALKSSSLNKDAILKGLADMKLQPMPEETNTQTTGKNPNQQQNPVNLNQNQQQANKPSY